MSAKKFFTAVCIVIINCQLPIIKCTAQTPDWLWAKSMGGTEIDAGNSVAVDASGNVYSTGTFRGTGDFDPGASVFHLTSVGNNDIFISKLDSMGNFIWAKSIGGSSGTDRSFCIALDDSGNVYTTGFFSETVDFNPGIGVYNLTAVGYYDIFVVKLDTAGNFIWAKAMSGPSLDQCQSLVLDHLGTNIYMVGHFRGTTDFDPGPGTFYLTSLSAEEDIYICKINSSGNFIWAKSFTGVSGVDVGLSIAIDPRGSGCLYVTGGFSGVVDFDPGPGVYNLTAAGNGQNIFISKFDTAGNFVWAKGMIGASASSPQRGVSIAVDTTGSGNVYATGVFCSTVDFDPGPGTFFLSPVNTCDMFIYKSDSAGNFVWAKSIIGAESSSLIISSDETESIYVTGNFDGTVDFDPGPGTYNLTSSGSDVFVAQYDSSGNVVWVQSAGGNAIEKSSDLASRPVANGNLYVTGLFWSNPASFGSTVLTNPGTNSSEIFIAKLDTIPNTTGTNEVVNFGCEVFVFPNPANDKLTIGYKNPNASGAIEEVEVYDVIGDRVLSKQQITSGQPVSIDVSSLNTGIYFLRIKTEIGFLTRKCIKL